MLYDLQSKLLATKIVYPGREHVLWMKKVINKYRVCNKSKNEMKIKEKINNFLTLSIWFSC